MALHILVSRLIRLFRFLAAGIPVLIDAFIASFRPWKPSVVIGSAIMRTKLRRFCLSLEEAAPGFSRAFDS